jgi:quinol monooxygenase YgiN
VAALKAHIDSEAYAKLISDVGPLLQLLDIKVMVPDAE